MTSFAQNAPAALQAWLTRAETWLDDRGQGAWVVAMALGLILFWPLGLALLAYMIWNRKVPFSSKFSGTGRNGATRQALRGTGNGAFDACKADTLCRLEEEQANFQAFLQRLRAARDKAEFDQIMRERGRATA